MIISMSNDGTPNSFYISPGGSRQIKVVISTLKGGDFERFDKTDFKIETEILAYKDNGINVHRRMATAKTRNITKNNTEMRYTYLSSIFPGNDQEHDYSKSINNFFVSPPKGKNITHAIGYVISIMCIVPLIGYQTYLLGRKIKSKIEKRKQ